MKLKKGMTEKWTQQSLKSKWALTSAFVIFISYLLICSVMYIGLQSWLLSNERKEVVRSIEDLNSFFEQRGHYLTFDELKQNESLINAIVDKNQTARILNKDGIEVLRINDTVSEIPKIPKNLTAQSYDIEKEKIDNESSYVATSKLQLGEFAGYVQVTHPLTSYTSMMNYLLTAMILMGLAALIASAMIGYALATRLLKPIDHLRHEMSRVAKAGFDVKLQLDDTRKDEIGELNQVYKQMMGELEASYLQQQRFISDASHELRTPIQVLEGHLNLIKRWGKDEPDIMEESLDTSISEVKRMRSLIEELLDLARREEKDSAKKTDLVAETKKVIEETKRLHPDTEIKFDSGGYEELETAISNDAYNQIVRNLLQNAINYSENLPVVRINLTNAHNYHRIEVEDSGIGIKPETLPRIFDRFFRVDEARSRDQGGTGLGLAIVKMLIEKYDGEIAVESQYGEGTKFTVLLPKKYEIN